MKSPVNELDTFAAEGSQLLQSRSPTSLEWDASTAATSLPSVNTLPAARSPAARSPALPGPRPERKPRADRIRIVVADDSPVALTCLYSLLSRHPRLDVVGTASNGMEALERVEALHPDLLLTDLEMPVFNGLDAARSVRARFPGTRIVIVSMHERPDLHNPNGEPTIDGFVSKLTLDGELIPFIERLFPNPPPAEQNQRS
jgi:two-component system, NarL family, vancomycin resistance associated response regulator VraR